VLVSLRHAHLVGPNRAENGDHFPIILAVTHRPV
jgi:hypothetical protein